MAKLILYFLVALGAAMYFPQSRALVLDTAEPVLNPLFRWSTEGEMRKIARGLEEFEKAWERLPSEQGQLQEWLDTTYEGDSKTDSWGNEYVLLVWADSFAVVSAGVDQEVGTVDDLKVGRTRPEYRRRHRR